MNSSSAVDHTYSLSRYIEFLALDPTAFDLFDATALPLPVDLPYAYCAIDDPRGTVVYTEPSNDDQDPHFRFKLCLGPRLRYIDLADCLSALLHLCREYHLSVIALEKTSLIQWTNFEQLLRLCFFQIPIKIVLVSPRNPEVHVP